MSRITKYVLIGAAVWFIIAATLIMFAKTDDPAPTGHITMEDGRLIYHTPEVGPGPPNVTLSRIKKGLPSKPRGHDK